MSSKWVENGDSKCPTLYNALCKKVVPCLREKAGISTVTFIQDGATSHTANPVKKFLIQTFGEEKVISKLCKFQWPHRFPDLTPADFRLFLVDT
ncbi:uncharacterized protein TNCV_158561 [Trichonephila clavipes]|uniref:Uncharacterized protein n=1 Tax=Trichonephila clavipes TaxID=2585209 RepID=A0A8X6UY91_TRICX|nr:uncharacterized protein TNCV_158561 [Trichonephila clavipes]